MGGAESVQAVVIHAAGDVRVEERPAPVPGPDEVTVSIERGGICGSDISYFLHGAVGDFTVRRPMVLGHEVVGRVSRVGHGVDPVLEGDFVVVDPSTPCGECDRCREGRSNACARPRFLGSASTDPHVDGGFVAELVTRVRNLVRVPSGLLAHDVVFAEPLAVTVHALRRAGGVRARRVLVVGAGPIGSMAIAAAAANGADEIVATDLDPQRLDTARRVGANQTVAASELDASVIAGGFDVVFEASGSGGGIASAIGAARKGGTVVLIGLPHGGPISVPIGLGVARELDLLGSFRFTHDEFTESVDLLGGGLDLRPLHTHSYGLDAVAEAFDTAASPGSLKVQLDFGTAE